MREEWNPPPALEALAARIHEAARGELMVVLGQDPEGAYGVYVNYVTGGAFCRRWSDAQEPLRLHRDVYMRLMLINALPIDPTLVPARWRRPDGSILTIAEYDGR